MEQAKVRESRTSRNLYLAVLSGTVGASFQFGFSTGFVNNMQDYVRFYFDHKLGIDSGSDEHFRFLWSIAVSGFAIGGTIGTVVFPKMANQIGRKRTILFTTFFCYASCYLIACPRNWFDFILGRIFVGIGAGGACGVVPTFITEIAPSELRGTLGTVHQLLITIGIFLAQALSTADFGLLGDNDRWQYCLLVPFACTTFLWFTLPLCVDSPVYLYRKKGHEAAKDALYWLRPNTEYAQKRIYRELNYINRELEISAANATIQDVVKDELLWRPLLVGCVVNLSMQFSGIDAVFYYSTKVFETAGMDTNTAQVATTMVGLANVIVTIPAMVFMDKAGRKVIQIAGLSGMCLSYVLLTFALVNGWHVVSILAMILIICFFAFGPGCIAWFIIAELVPMHARGVATTVALLVNWGANWLIAFIFPQLQAQFHQWTFIIFVFSTAILALYTLVFLPETKGKSVLEIRETFSSDSLFKVPSEPNFLKAKKGNNSNLKSPLLNEASSPPSPPAPLSGLGGKKAPSLQDLAAMAMAEETSGPPKLAKEGQDVYVIQTMPD